VKRMSAVVKLVAALAITGSAVVYAGGGGKVDVCHIPPGNPANAHTINVSVNAVPAHLAHGDNLGACGATERCADIGGSCTEADQCFNGYTPGSFDCSPSQVCCNQGE
jgi:hypothetical protein